MIVELGGTKDRIFVLVDRARGWTLDTSDQAPAWREFDSNTEVAGIGGRVLTAVEAALLRLTYGWPQEINHE